MVADSAGLHLEVDSDSVDLEEMEEAEASGITTTLEDRHSDAAVVATTPAQAAKRKSHMSTYSTLADELRVSYAFSRHGSNVSSHSRPFLFV